MNKKTAAWIQLITSCILVLFLTAILVFGIRNGGLISFGSFRVTKDLEITVPRKMCNTEYLTLSTDAVSSDITIQDIDVKALKTDSVSGSINYEGNAANIQCDTVSGDCTLISHLTPSTVKTDGVSANITLQVPDSSVFSAEYDGVLDSAVSSICHKMVSRRFHP